EREIQGRRDFEGALVTWEYGDADAQLLNQRGFVRDVRIGECQSAREKVTTEDLWRLNCNVAGAIRRVDDPGIDDPFDGVLEGYTWNGRAARLCCLKTASEQLRWGQRAGGVVNGHPI